MRGSPPAPRPRPPLLRRIGTLILAFNLLLVIIPVGAFLVLGTYERSLLAALEDSLVQQGRLVAAWLGEAELDPAAAGRVLAAIGARRTARIRVVDSGGLVLADSARLEGAGAAGQSDPALAPAAAAPLSSSPPSSPEGRVEEARRKVESLPESSPLYRLLSLPIRLYREYLAPPSPPLDSADVYGSARVLAGSEVRAALEGRYGAATRISSGGQVSVTLYSAIPVRRGGGVAGAVLVSQSTFRILRELYALRLDIGRVFLGGAGLALALSLVLSLYIILPVSRLSRAAARALGGGSRAGGALEHFPELRRGDEIGELGESLRGMARRLDARLEESERFAADLAHEFKNPLAAIRSSAELLEEAATEEERRAFARAIVAEVERLRARVDGLRRLARAEAAGGGEGAPPLSLEAAVRASWARVGAEARGRPLALEFAAEPGAPSLIRLEEGRLESLLDNLLGNAASFARSRVLVRLRPAGEDFLLEVEDDGPGIPETHLGRVFERFFTWREGEARGEHTGLGLSLVKAVLEAEGGSIRAENRPAPASGARFAARLPLRLADTSPSP